MNRKTIIIIVVVVLAAVCICATVAGVILFTRAGAFLREASSTEPQDVDDTVSQIVDLELPPGVTPAMSMNLLGITMVGYTAPDNNTTIFLFQVPPNTDMPMEQFQEQIKRMAEQQTGERFNLEEIGSQTYTIRGQTTDLTIYEGTGNSGNTIRQMIGAFEGKGGPAWIIVSGPTSTWDQQLIDRFINAMR